MEILEHVSKHRDEGPPGIVRRKLDHLDRAPLRHRLRSDVRPVAARIPGDVHSSIVASGPQKSSLEGRLLESEDVGVDLDPGVLLRDRLARVVLFLLVVAGEIGAYDLPALSSVARTMHHLRGVVEDVGIVRREPDGSVPVETIAKVLGREADLHLSVGHDLTALTGGEILAGDLACRNSRRRRCWYFADRRRSGRPRSLRRPASRDRE